MESAKEPSTKTRELLSGQDDAGQDRFRMLVDAARDYAIVMLDTDGKIAIWNAGAEHLTGYDAEEAIGRPITILYGDNDGESESLIARARESGKAEMEGLRKRKDSSTFWAHTVLTSLYDRTGAELVGYCEITRDLSERRKYEEEMRNLNLNLERLVSERTAELEAANKELEAFSYSVSHDLRAPLRSIDGFAKVLLEDHADKLEPDVLRNLEIISRNAVRMGCLIDDLLNFSRVNRVRFAYSWVELEPIARSCFDEQMAEVPGREIRFTVRHMPPVYGDRPMLKQVMVNVMSNAIKFTSERASAEIEMGSFIKDSVTVYYVKDNGVGFDMRYVSKLFGPFQRLHKMSEFPGTGIGLALVQRIIHRHGGAVWIQGELDRGATIYFTVPGGKKDERS